MRSRRRIVALCGALLALVAFSSACSSLRDKQPFTVTVTYDDHSGKFQLIPPVIEGDASFGEIQLVNNTSRKHGFAIDELAVFETIPAGRTKTISVQEAKDNHSYTFYCQLHPKEFRGTLKIHYVAENER